LRYAYFRFFSLLCSCFDPLAHIGTSTFMCSPGQQWRRLVLVQLLGHID
jgi:hypothetical protein